MTRDDIFHGVRQVLIRQVGVPASTPLTAATSLRADLALDSLKALTLIVGIESHFRIRLAYGDEDGVATLADLVSLIALRLMDSSEAT